MRTTYELQADSLKDLFNDVIKTLSNDFPYDGNEISFEFTCKTTGIKTDNHLLNVEGVLIVIKE